MGKLKKNQQVSGFRKKAVDRETRRLGRGKKMMSLPLRGKERKGSIPDKRTHDYDVEKGSGNVYSTKTEGQVGHFMGHGQTFPDRKGPSFRTVAQRKKNNLHVCGTKKKKTGPLGPGGRIVRGPLPEKTRNCSQRANYYQENRPREVGGECDQS